MEMEKKICAVGIDITEDYVQLSYSISEKDEPVSLSVSSEEQKYLIPPVLYYREENDIWYIGDEALYNSHSDRKDTINIYEQLSFKNRFLSIFLDKLIEKAKTQGNFRYIKSICVSVEKDNIDIIKNVFSSFELLDYKDTIIRVINHDEAFLYYTINQKKDLWVNDVALLDFTKKHFKYRRMKEYKMKTPPVLTVWQDDISTDISYEMLDTEAGKKRADSRLFEYVHQEFKKNIVCSVFLTGAGFYDQWAEESLQEICSKRRVFKGYNLFVKGACYAAIKKQRENVKKQNIFQCNGRTRADIGLLISNEGKNMVITLSSAGTNWYEAGAEAECILDNVSKISMVIISAFDGSSKNKSIDLSQFPSRPNKTTRVKITLGYRDEDKFDIIIKDMGFGELFKASGMMVRESVSVSKLFDI